MSPLPVPSAAVTDAAEIDPAVMRAGVLAEAHRFAELVAEANAGRQGAKAAADEQALVIRACEHSLMLCRATSMAGALQQLCLVAAKVTTISEDPMQAKTLRLDLAATVVGLRSVIRLIEAAHDLDRMAGPSLAAFYWPRSAEPADIFRGAALGAADACRPV